MSKERPILFSGPMVRAIRAGTKTQTRRTMKPDGKYRLDLVAPADGGPSHCPYGQPGDVLWVREAFRTVEVADSLPPRALDAAYRLWYEADAPHQPGFGKLRPGMFMPRWASRITLQLTGVRVERLKDISEADADAEGCERLESERYEPDFKLCPRCGGTRLYTAFHPATGGALPDTDCTDCDTYAKRYRHLWESINGPESWAANPWVWVVEFKRVKP